MYHVQFGRVSLHGEKTLVKKNLKKIRLIRNLLPTVKVMFTASHGVFPPMKMKLEKVETSGESPTGNERQILVCSVCITAQTDHDYGSFQRSKLRVLLGTD